MTKKHTTSLGKPFDMDAFRAKNEKVRAVGNMSVNARGDIIDSNNRVINDANRRVSEMYKKTMQNYTPAKQTKPAKTQPPVDPIVEPGPDDLDLDVPNPKK